MSEMRIYVASLSDYNNGHLHGVWIDLDDTTELEEIDEAVRALLRGSKFPNVEVECPECEGEPARACYVLTCSACGTVEQYPDGAEGITANKQRCKGCLAVAFGLRTSRRIAAKDRLCEGCNGSGKVPSAEEWAVHDYDGIPSAFGEHPDLDDILEFVKGVEEHGDAFRAWVEDRGVTNFIHEDFQDKYAGEADSKREWAENFVEELGVLEGVPKNLRPYFDEEQYVRDMELNGGIGFVEF